MSPITLELKPDRLLLDSNFDGYKLSLQEIPTSRKDFDVAVDKILLDSNQYSLLQAKLFGLHNHLFADRFDNSNAVYFIDKDLNIKKTYVDLLTNNLVHPVTIYTIPRLRERQSGDYNVSMCFASPQYAIVSDGIGTIHITDTKDKNDDDCFETVFSGQVLDDEHQGFIIKDALYLDECQDLHVLLIQIQEDSVERFVSIIHWLTFKQTSNGDNKTWYQTVLRRLKTKGEVQYLHLEKNCENIYVVSENTVDFVLNSEHPIKDDVSISDPKKIYKWSQTGEEIFVKITLPQNAQKNLTSVLAEATKINICYNSEIILSGSFFSKIDPNLTTWTLDSDILEIVLYKLEETGFWPEFIKGDQKGEYIINTCIVDQVNNRMENFTSNIEALPQSGTTFNSQQIEECDFETDKSETFERINGTTNTVTHKIHLGSHQIILSPYLTTEGAPALGIRHDVDVCLWQPIFETENFMINHEGTLLAFGYVQASKQNRKFTTCSPKLNYAVISESSGHIFIYCQNKPLFSTELRQRTTGQRVKNVAQQQVLNLPNQEILGLYAHNRYLFVLGQHFIMSLDIGDFGQ